VSKDGPQTDGPPLHIHAKNGAGSTPMEDEGFTRVPRRLASTHEKYKSNSSNYPYIKLLASTNGI